MNPAPDSIHLYLLCSRLGQRVHCVLLPAYTAADALVQWQTAYSGKYIACAGELMPLQTTPHTIMPLSGAEAIRRAVAADPTFRTAFDADARLTVSSLQWTDPRREPSARIGRSD